MGGAWRVFFVFGGRAGLVRPLPGRKKKGLLLFRTYVYTCTTAYICYDSALNIVLLYILLLYCA